MTAKQERFVKAYLKCLNATEAAKKSGYSERSAKTLGARLLANPDVKREIATRQAAIAKHADIEKASLVRQLAAMIFTNVSDIVEWDGGTLKVKPLSEIPGEFHPAIQKIERRADGTATIEMVPKLPLIAELNKMLGYYAEEAQEQVLPTFGVFLDVPGKCPGTPPGVEALELPPEGESEADDGGSRQGCLPK